jgi:hypothetical protein
MKICAFCLLVVFTLPAMGIEAISAEEVLFERKLSEEERAHFTLFTFQKDVSKYATIEHIREIYTGEAKAGLEDRQLLSFA